VIFRVAIVVVGALAIAWLLLVGYLLVRRPAEGTTRAALRVVPDAVRLLRRIAGDRSLARGVRVRLWLLLAYLLFPVDLVPDFLPVVGYMDDVVIAATALRSVVRRAGASAVRRHWPGTEEGLAALWAITGLPGSPPPPDVKDA
jgi:uncharacterized membrane protein YkvA (DUF1232 family)